MIELRVGAVIALLVLFVGWTAASTGDRSQFFINCVRGCRVSNCSDGIILFIGSNIHPSGRLYCGFDCRWPHLCQREESQEPGFLQSPAAVDVQRWMSLSLSMANDQFVRGKEMASATVLRQGERYWNPFALTYFTKEKSIFQWPFMRLLGMQEPASVLFSLLNLIVHWRMIRKFRREVRPDSSMYYVWHVFCMVRPTHDSWLFCKEYQHFWPFSVVLDLHKRVDILDNIPYQRLSHYRTLRLWLCVFDGDNEFLLYGLAVSLNTFSRPQLPYQYLEIRCFSECCTNRRTS